jgi:hypothetical protein
VRARLAWLAGGIGVGAAAAYRALRGGPASQPPRVEEQPDPRAEELRQKLAEARAAVDEREEFESGETPVDRAPDPEPDLADLDERRRRVHERARASARRMRGREPEA